MANLLAGVPITLKDGREVNASDHLRGKIVVLYFSASWCHPCRDFFPYIKEFYDRLAPYRNAVEVVLVSRDYMRFQLSEYYEKHGCSWAYIPLKHPIVNQLFQRYNVEALPTCLVVNSDGQVIDGHAEHQVKVFFNR
ncbi:hypothetical protein WR25_20868 isoform B [Diploscapter pachys]|uniref:Thioredoxin domain-containing protein n=1 Tax=Diploscapter pachys TaxID=2018661 RepID=A0A2A2JPM2_9BILA|nr:hypothetical protein WR25_20868 isoform B [Diploscapter pachys]